MHIYRNELLGLFGIPVPTTVFTIQGMERAKVDWFKMALESQLAVMMSMHKRLGAESALSVLDEDSVKVICDMLTIA